MNIQRCSSLTPFQSEKHTLHYSLFLRRTSLWENVISYIHYFAFVVLPHLYPNRLIHVVMFLLTYLFLSLFINSSASSTSSRGYGRHLKTAIVFDNGSQYMKVGLIDEKKPSIELPNVISRDIVESFNSRFIGLEAVKNCTVSPYEYPTVGKHYKPSPHPPRQNERCRGGRVGVVGYFLVVKLRSHN